MRCWRNVDGKEVPSSLSFLYQGGEKSFPEASSRRPLRCYWPGLVHTDKRITGVEGDAKAITAHPGFMGKGRHVRKIGVLSGGANITCHVASFQALHRPCLTPSSWFFILQDILLFSSFSGTQTPLLSLPFLFF